MQKNITRGENNIQIRDAAGVIRAVVQEDPEGPLALFFDAEGDPAGGLAFTPTRELTITLVDGEGRAKLVFALRDDGPWVFAVDPATGQMRHARGVFDDPATIGDLVATPN